MPGPGRVELIYTPDNGGEGQKFTVHKFEDGGGVALGMYNTDQVNEQGCTLILSSPRGGWKLVSNDAREVAIIPT